MATTLKNIKIPYPTEGVIRSAQLNDTVCPENSVQLAVNMNFDTIGAMKTRLGIEQYMNIGLANIQAFGTIAIPATNTYGVFAQWGLNIRYFTDGSGSVVVRSMPGTLKARFSQYLNYVWMCNGYNGSAVQTSNGGVFGTTMVPGGFPKGDYIQAGFEGRVWIADKSTDTIYYTDIVQFTPPSTYTLTFDINTNYISNLSPQDGETITGLVRVPRALLVFKQNHIYRIYGATSIDSYPAYNVGTYSQESVITTKDGIYFHHSSGFYKFTYDGQPTEISRRVIDFVRAIPRANYENVVGMYDGFDAVKWAVGPVTVEGVTYSSCVMRYTISTQVWTIYDYEGTNIASLISFDNGTTITQLVGTSTGLIGSLDTGYKDFGRSIYYEFIDRWRSFTEMYSKAKSISGLMIMADNGAGAGLEYQTEKSEPNVWTPLETLTEDYDSLMPNANTDDFNNIRLRLKGYSSGTPILFHGIELLSIQDKGLNQN